MSNRYETIPHMVEAIQLSFVTMGAIVELTKASNYNVTIKNGTVNMIITVNNVKMLAIEGDYVVKDGDEILVVKKKDFEQNYRPVEEE